MTEQRHSYSNIRSLRLLLLTAAFCFLYSAQSKATGEEWTAVKLPSDWKPSAPNGDSVYRTWFEVPASWQDRRVDIFLEGGDDAREIYINGKLITVLGGMPPNYKSGLGTTGRFDVPHEHLKFDAANLIEIRIHRRGGRTNLNVAAPALFAENFAMHLMGSWQKQIGASLSKPDAASEDNMLFSDVEDAADVTSKLQRLDGDLGPLSPSQSMELLTPDPAFELDLILADPVIGQPLSMKWDERGRLWVAEYRQYPDPAGLKRVSRDPFLRTVYDRVPPAPPNHYVGKDRISIHEDTDGDGRLDRHDVFVDGLNLMTSFALGYGGVFVLNPPYLLFYPDQDGDDRPDGDPQVLLEGFGLEDSHSLANSLRLAPDGWLYAAQGSTVSGKIRRPGSDEPPVNSLGQLIWRYHPVSKKYEVFAEGGGNAFGVELDSAGRIYSGHNGGDTRGFHYVQGGYFQKGFSKHGALSNPYTFGYFPWMKHHQVPRFTHTFVIEESGVIPAPYAGRLYGVEPLQGRVVMSEVSPDGSTYRTADVGYALTSKDTWFRPVDIQSGPDGGLYVADFYEQRIDHSSHYQGRVSPETGRIYRLRARGNDAEPSLPGSTPAEWLESLKSSNRWTRHETIRLIRDHQPTELLDDLRDMVENESQYSLDALWAIHALGALHEEWLASQLNHEQPVVRSWLIRLASEQQRLSSTVLRALLERSSVEEHPQVLSQLACSARLLPPAINLQLVQQLAAQDSNASDPHLPLLLWWSIESLADSHPGAIVKLVENSEFSNSSLAKSELLPRIMKRFAVTGRQDAMITCGELLKSAPNEAVVERLLVGFDEAVAGRPLADLPSLLVEQLALHRPESLELQLLLGNSEAYQKAIARIQSSDLESEERVQLIDLLSTQSRPEDTELWLQIAVGENPESVVLAALGALSKSADPSIALQIIGHWDAYRPAEKEVAQSLLASREAWSHPLLTAVTEKLIPANAINLQTLRRIRYHRSNDLDAKIKQLWPSVEMTDSRLPEDVLEAWSQKVVSGLGNPYDGRTLFQEKCGKCHRLFGKGGDLGPDLTSYQRTDLSRLMANVLDPSLEIREGYETAVIETDDGLIVSGFVENRDEVLVSLRQVDGQLVRIPVETIEDEYRSKVSLMPSGLLDELTAQQVRDLFAFLRSSQPLP